LSDLFEGVKKGTGFSILISVLTVPLFLKAKLFFLNQFDDKHIANNSNELNPKPIRLEGLLLGIDHASPKLSKEILKI